MTKNIRNAQEIFNQMYAERDQMGCVTFLVDSQRILAHRSILATQSPNYKAQFYGPHRDVGEIRVENVSAAAFNVFLQFFYNETVDLTMDNIEMILDLAMQSLVNEFIETCVNFLKGAVKANKFFIPYRLAFFYDIKSLRLACKQRISTNTNDIFASDDFLRCDRDTLLQILKMDSLHCTENDVFTACIDWARAQCKRDNLDDGKPENLCTALGDVIYHIRFSSFNAEEFAVLHKSMEGLFTADESIELFYMIGKLKDFKPQKFNQTVRTPDVTLNIFDEENIFWSLEVPRFVIIKGQSLGIVKIGRVQWECSSPIRLHGIALGVRFNTTDFENFPETFSIQTDYGSLKSKYTIFQSSTKHDESIIVFEQPIKSITTFLCDFELPSKQLNYKHIVKPSVQVQGIKFTFDSKWVTRVFCDKVHAA